MFSGSIDGAAVGSRQWGAVMHMISGPGHKPGLSAAMKASKASSPTTCTKSSSLVIATTPESRCKGNHLVSKTPRTALMQREFQDAAIRSGGGRTDRRRLRLADTGTRREDR